MAGDRWGNVYVADTVNARIQKFTFEGDFLASWPCNVSGNSYWPPSLTLDGQGKLYLTDTGHNCVLVFANPNPSPVSTILNLLLD